MARLNSKRLKMAIDPEQEIRRQVGVRIRLTRYAIWGSKSGDRKKCLADMEISTNQLSRWETGQSEPSALFIVNLHEKHDVTADWIFLNDERRLPGELIEKINKIRAKMRTK